ncbi:MAG: hypothetical protein Q7R52_05625 [archaeon]|nr:hypothetical protein [archaeon]
MRKILFAFFAILMISMVSSELILEDTKEVYNFGDTFSVPLIVKATSDEYGFLEMFLLCNGKETEFYKEYIILASGEERKINPSLKLTKNIAGLYAGVCKIKASFNNDYKLTKDFQLSDSIILNLTYDKQEFNPEEAISIYGAATKKNGEFVNGLVESTVTSGNYTTIIYDTANNGFFLINFSMPQDAKSELYTLNILVYEKDSNSDIINKGSLSYSFLILQVPTILKLETENNTDNIIPGEIIRIKTMLLDQAGDNMNGIATITLKNGADNILKKEDKEMGQFIEYPVKYNEKPSTWTVYANSNELISEKKLNLIEKKEIKIELVNDTLIITNMGNVFYNDTTQINIGNESLDINPSLNVDETKKYQLIAPNGEYSIEVIRDGESKISGMAILSGDSVSIREISAGSNFKFNPLVLLFVAALVILIAVFIFFRKKNYFGGFSSRNSFSQSPPPRLKPVARPQESSGRMPESLSGRPANVKETRSYSPMAQKLPREITIIEKDRRAVLESSIQGQKQESSIVALKIKNRFEVGSSGASKEAMQKIISFAEDKRGILYENGDYLMFILSPTVTKTSRNEKIAVDIAMEIKRRLDEHNKMFKQRINYGIAANYGAMIAKPEGAVLKFMGLGNFLNSAKKLASISNGDIFLSNEIIDKVRGDVKAEKVVLEGNNFYVIKDAKNRDESARFVGEFMKRH